MIKKFSLIVVICILFVSICNIACADRLHGFHENWVIRDSEFTSAGHRWTALFSVSSGHLYIETKAQSPNQGVTQYYCVTPSTISYMTGRIKVGLTNTVHRDTSMAPVGGHSYYTFAQKWDSSLTTTITYGQTFIKSDTNS